MEALPIVVLDWTDANALSHVMLPLVHTAPSAHCDGQCVLYLLKTHPVHPQVSLILSCLMLALRQST